MHSIPVEPSPALESPDGLPANQRAVLVARASRTGMDPVTTAIRKLDLYCNDRGAHKIPEVIKQRLQMLPTKHTLKCINDSMRTHIKDPRGLLNWMCTQSERHADNLHPEAAWQQGDILQMGERNLE